VTRPHLPPRVRMLVRFGFFATLIALFALALHGRWPQVQDSFEQLSWYSLLIAAALGFGNIFAAMMAWRSLLGDLGSKLPMPVAMRIFFLGQLGKYLPGSVWTVVAQADLGRDHSIPPRRTVAASVVGMGISLAAGLVLAIVTLPFSAPGEAVHYAWVLLVLPLLVVGLLPKNVDRLTRLLLKVLRREPPDHAFTWRGVVTALGWQTSSWVAVGGEVFVLCWALHAPIARTLPLALGATALAWSAGFLAVPLPSGAGLRELITIAMLSSVLSVPSATVVALTSRIISIVGDGAFAAVAVAIARHNGLHLLAAARQRAKQDARISARADAQAAQAAQSSPRPAP
jgi:glycosyltransferase 2 family protein